ncbi:M48 family metallopeptidase [Desulfosarcina sp. OttesenSCG-928-A07]|nr:M48 family metallopeptidase [Desulfosarcina sp. OttesenSCG-928-G17]MDL2329994.1 M48 family metallopeptidase [Desulfosarcina sp. OttesenSCG-928-A07]
MKSKFFSTFLFCCLVFFVVSCTSVPITGRSQLNLVSDSTLMAQSEAQYREFLNENTPLTGTANQAMVQRVGKKIAAAAETYFNAKGTPEVLNGFSWEFNLVKDDTPNAWCMPGGKVAVFTGILPYTKDENGLAVVMSHEVAHAVARHGNERVSQNMVAGLGGQVLGLATKNQSAALSQGLQKAYSVGGQMGVLLPFSRKHESEADELGLYFMSMAGYDPRKAPEFWERMAQGGSSTPEFFSTHPSDQTRINNLNQNMPKALEFYTGK